jgi:two-component system chemotaxis response regulator CheB
MSHAKIKVMIVEDSPTVQRLLAGILGGDPAIEVAAVAGGGEQAIALLAASRPADRPQVVTVDINMPGMNGFETTRRIMESHPLPVVIVSASWQPDEVATTFRALEAGALAVVGKPRGPGHPESEQDARKLLETVKAMSEVKVVKRWSRLRSSPGPATPVAPATPGVDLRLVAIGASTGGPAVLQTILAALPKSFPVPIVIVQHIAAGFLQGMVDWLAQTTGLPVHVATQGEPLLPGHAYLAPDGVHLGVSAAGTAVLSAAEPDDGLRPSVAHLFASVAHAYGPAAAGVLLTGMGRDGAAELKRLRQRGALTIVQDRDSSVVFGMPGEAVQLGAAAHVLSPEKIAALLASAVRRP